MFLYFKKSVHVVDCFKCYCFLIYFFFSKLFLEKKVELIIVFLFDSFLIANYFDNK